MLQNKGDYIVFVDESGDHGLQNIDPDYPIFVLSFCCFNIEEYVTRVVPNIQKFKFKHFGHDQVILHEHHIRKQNGHYAFLRRDKKLRTQFLSDVSALVADTPFKIISIIIDKSKLTHQYTHPYNPYHLSLRFGLERLLQLLISKDQKGKSIYLIFEKRGKKEDESLELEFRRICDSNQQFGYRGYDFRNTITFKAIFADKKTNSCGLQIADLTARPIGLNYLRPYQINRAFEIISKKIYQHKQFP